jgi:hypothetical protein
LINVPKFRGLLTNEDARMGAAVSEPQYFNRGLETATPLRKTTVFKIIKPSAFFPHSGGKALTVVSGKGGRYQRLTPHAHWGAGEGPVVHNRAQAETGPACYPCYFLTISLKKV